jgi:hypothetical protein
VIARLQVQMRSSNCCGWFGAIDKLLNNKEMISILMTLVRMNRRLTMKRFFMLGIFSLFMLTLPGKSLGDTLVLQNGTRISGTLVKRTSTTISFKNSHGVVHRYQASQVRNVDLTSKGNTTYRPARNNGSSNNDNQPELLPAGTQLVILTNEAIDSKTAASNQLYSAQVDQDIIDSSNELIVPKGSPAQLIIRTISSGGVTGSPEITLDIQSITVNGRRYNVTTTDLREKGKGGIGANKRTAEMVGGGAVIGTIIGAIVGHGKGAAIGAAVGATGGAGAQVLTKGKQVIIPAETVLKFSLDQAVTLAPER